MFMDDDSAFDVPSDNQRTSKYLQGETSRPTTSGGGIGRMSLRDIDDDDDNVRGPDSGTAMSNRARMLEKQREIQLSKRQSLAGGQQMMRKSNDGPVAPNSPVRDSQTTPAMRQFSQPKATANEDNDRASTEFGRTSRNGPPSAQKVPKSNRYSDEDEDVRPSRSGQYNDSRSGSRGQRRSDNDDDEYDYRNSSRKNNNRGDSRERGSNRDRNDRDYDRPPRDDRRRDDSRDRRGGGGNDNYNSRENSSRNRRDDSRDKYDNGGRNSRNNDDDWNGGRGKGGGGRDNDRDDRNHSNSRKSRRDDDDDSRDGGDRNRRGGGGGGGDRSPPRSQERRGNNNNGNSRDWDSAGRPDDRRRGGGNDSDRDNRDNRDRDRDRNGGGKSKQRNDNDDDHQDAVPKEVFVPPDYSNMRRFLTSPLPKNNGILQCYIRRNKSGTNKLYPVYSLYLKEGDVFLMASRKRPKNKTSNYLISLDQNDLNRSGNNYLGKLRSNFVGTEFQIFDNGVNPKDTEPDEVVRADASVRCELGSVMYAANVMGSRGPRKMQVALPGLDENGQITKWKDGSGPASAKGEHTGSESDILSHMKDRNFKDLVYLINKPPRWNEQVGAYVLNFNGRVTMASVKNFQLVDPDEQNAVVLQFGRVGKDEFTMDFQWPISPYQAFAVTLSSFDSKIACD